MSLFTKKQKRKSLVGPLLHNLLLSGLIVCDVSLPYQLRATTRNLLPPQSHRPFLPNFGKENE